jgi:hypothetical protein
MFITGTDRRVDDVTRLIIDKIDGVNTNLKAALETGLEKVDSKIEGLTQKVDTQNGRVKTLELWRHGSERVKEKGSWRFQAFIVISTGLSVSLIGTLAAIYINKLVG